MVTRRSLIALSAAMPLVNMKSLLDVEDTEIPALDTGDVTILGISPDASTLVGMRGRDVLCFLDSTSLELISESNSLPEIGLIDSKSINWSPDGTRLAFSLDAWVLFRDSDIWVVDVDSAEITNATPEGHKKEADSLTQESDVVVDVYPVWTGDNELLFARHERVETDGPFAVSIQSITPGSGEPTVVVDLKSTDIRYVLSPIELLADGSMIFTSQTDELKRSDITKVKAPDEITTIASGDLQYKIQLSVNDTSSLVVSLQEVSMWILPLDNTEDITRLEDAMGYEDQAFIGEPAIASNPETYAGVTEQTSSEKFRVLTNIDGKRRDCGYLQGGVGSQPFCHLAGNTLLITTRKAAWMIELES